MSKLAKYSDVVLAVYENLKASNNLSLNMRNPTPANLKKECLNLAKQGYSPKDSKILFEFFDKKEEEEPLIKTIKKFENDKLKSLQDFIQGETKTTSERNVELLAWLIDFQPRPEQYDYIYEMPPANDEVKGEKETAISSDEEINDDETTPKEDNTQTITEPLGEKNSPKPIIKRQKKITKYVGLTIGAIVVFTLISYWQSQEKNSSGLMNFNLSAFGSCMYWTGEQYEQISCGQKRGDTLIIALDAEKLKRLKRITQTDTISYNSRGFVWYVKINGELEYYTSDGQHPVYQQLRLRPITDYIIRKYIKGETN
jgi:hypothetical protein